MLEHQAHPNMPQINQDRPKIALRRIEQWTKGRAEPDAFWHRVNMLKLAIRQYDFNRRTSAQAKSRENYERRLADLRDLLL